MEGITCVTGQFYPAKASGQKFLNDEEILNHRPLIKSSLDLTTFQLCVHMHTHTHTYTLSILFTLCYDLSNLF